MAYIIFRQRQWVGSALLHDIWLFAEIVGFGSPTDFLINENNGRNGATRSIETETARRLGNIRQPFYSVFAFRSTRISWSTLTEVQRVALDPPYMYNRPIIEDDGDTVTRPRWEVESPPEAWEREGFRKR